MKHVKWSIVAIAATLSAAVFAQPTIDGTRDALYGSPIVVQNTQTGFGDSNLGQVDYANGSELDAAYAYVDMSRPDPVPVPGRQPRIELQQAGNLLRYGCRGAEPPARR
jgi:hypothetical protein